jgi:hypothetical protein
MNEMRKKSPATIQKWVDSIAVDQCEASSEEYKGTTEGEKSICDSNELKTNEPSTSDDLKGKLGEICNKLSLKSKNLEFKNLFVKATHKLRQDPSMEKIDTFSVESKDECKSNENKLTAQRSHISILGRSVSENPPPASSRRRLNDIGRSFSVANDSELPTAENSSENLIYDGDEDISITIPSINTSPSIISINTNRSLSNSQLMPAKVNLVPVQPLREHTVSEGHQSPQVLPKNPLLRDSSFQVSRKFVFFRFGNSIAFVPSRIQVIVQASNHC